jgi:hypothetical protein
MDIDARYVDVAVQRWEKFSGGQAQLSGSGETFQQLRAARGR